MGLIVDPISPDSPRPFAFTPRGLVRYEKPRPGDPAWEQAEYLRKVAAVTTLAGFIRYAWPILEPGRPLVWGPHLDVVCYALEQLAFGNIEGNELVINIPPRHLKSVTVSQCFPAWLWLYAPWIQTIGLSVSDRLAIKDASAMRQIVEHPRYKELVKFAAEYLGENAWVEAWGLRDDQNQKMAFRNTAGGHRMALAAGANIIGLGADVFLVDDPIDAKKAQEGGSEAIMGNMMETIERYGGVWHSRLNDPKRSIRVTIMQRLHEADLAGYLLASGVAHVVLPTEYNPNHPWRCEFDWRTEPGELLFPERTGLDEVAYLKKNWTPEQYSAQHDQLPTPMGGGKFPSDIWRYFEDSPELIWHKAQKGGKIITSFDCASKDNERAAFSVVYVLAKMNFTNMLYVIDEFRGQWEYSALDRTFDNIQEKYRPYMNVIEDASAGIQLLQMKRAHRVHGITPSEYGGKVERANYTQNRLHRGLLEIPDPQRRPWAQGLVSEHASFPRGQYADRVDALSQGCLYVDVIDAPAATTTNVDTFRFLEDLGKAAYKLGYKVRR